MKTEPNLHTYIGYGLLITGLLVCMIGFWQTVRGPRQKMPSGTSMCAVISLLITLGTIYGAITPFTYNVLVKLFSHSDIFSIVSPWFIAVGLICSTVACWYLRVPLLNTFLLPVNAGETVVTQSTLTFRTLDTQQREREGYTTPIPGIRAYPGTGLISPFEQKKWTVVTTSRTIVAPKNKDETSFRTKGTDDCPTRVVTINWTIEDVVPLAGFEPNYVMMSEKDREQRIRNTAVTVLRNLIGNKTYDEFTIAVASDTSWLTTEFRAGTYGGPETITLEERLMGVLIGAGVKVVSWSDDALVAKVIEEAARLRELVKQIMQLHEKFEGELTIAQCAAFVASAFGLETNFQEILINGAGSFDPRGGGNFLTHMLSAAQRRGGGGQQRGGGNPQGGGRGGNRGGRNRGNGGNPP